MSRRRAAPKRQILPDPLFKDLLVAKAINVSMKDGKKSVSEKNFYGALQVFLNLLEKEFKSGSGSMSASEPSREKEAKPPQFGDIHKDPEARRTALEAFKAALNKIKPKVEVQSRRVGGSNYQVPVEVRPLRQVALALRWLFEFARKRSEKTMTQKLAKELYDAYHRNGGAIKKREEVKRMAEANRAFSHYNWS